MTISLEASAAPKFPMGHLLSFLLRRADATGNPALTRMVEHTLTSMHRGGMYDHLGGGFCRYSVDRQWTVPHFEKMLYDNALLLTAYVDAYLFSRDERYAAIARDIISYVRRDLTDEDGGFYSGENADSEGLEGKYYVFTDEEVGEAVGPEHTAAVKEYFGITPAGNFEHGRNVLHIAVDPDAWREKHGLDEHAAAVLLHMAIARLSALRDQRVRPSLDDKILTSWNGLMISALARAAQALDDADALSMARKATSFLLERMGHDGDRLHHRYHRGVVGIDGFLEDYAFLVQGLIDLYEATFEDRFLLHALDITTRMLGEFAISDSGALSMTGMDHTDLPLRPVDSHDGALPSANSIAAMNLLRLARITGDSALERRAEDIITAFGRTIAGHPQGFAAMLAALDYAQGSAREIVLAAPTKHAVQDMASLVRKTWRPRTVLLCHDASPGGDALRARIPLLSQMVPLDGQPTAFICSGFACDEPVRTREDLRDILRR